MGSIVDDLVSDRDLELLCLDAATVTDQLDTIETLLTELRRDVDDARMGGTDLRAVGIRLANLGSWCHTNAAVILDTAKQAGGFADRELPSPAQEIAHATGLDGHHAQQLLRVGRRARTLPALAQALRAGAVTVGQADKIAGAAECVPDPDDRDAQVDRLLELAARNDDGDLTEECRRVRRDARGEQDHERVKRRRFARGWLDDDGAGNLLLRTTADEFARAMATLHAETASRMNRCTDRTVTPGNHAADALVDLICGHKRRRDYHTEEPATAGAAVGAVYGADLGSGEPSEGTDGATWWRDEDGTDLRVWPDGTFERHRRDSVFRRNPIPGITPNEFWADPWGHSTRHGGQPWQNNTYPLGPDPAPESHGWGRCPTCGHDNTARPYWRRGVQPKAILRLDLTALANGTIGDGETCDIAGYGPIPLAAARELLSDAAVSLVCTTGTDVVNVTNLTRKLRAAQRTAVEWLLPNRCGKPGCQCHERTELDHVLDYAHTRRTTTRDTQAACRPCNRTKPPNTDWRPQRE